MFVMHNLKNIKMFGRKYIESNTIRIVVLHHLVDLMMFRPDRYHNWKFGDPDIHVTLWPLEFLH